MSDLTVESLSASPSAVVAQEKKRKSPVKKFTMGVVEKITANVLFAVLTVLFGAAAVYYAQPNTEPTIYIDVVTGCQYLTTGAGITPRLDRIGFQICGE